MNICFYTDFTMSGMTGGIGRVTTVLTDYFREHFGWKVFSIYAFQAKADCKLTENDGAIQLRLHDRLGMRRLGINYVKAAQFIKEHKIQLVIIQTSMDVVARLRSVLNEQGLKDVKVISVLHYTPGTDEFPISTSELWSDFRKGKASIKALAKGVIAPIYNMWEHQATVQAYRKAYEYGDKVVLLSDSYIPMYQKFAGLKEQSNLCALPNSVPFEYNLSEEEIQQKKKTALMVGRMVDFPKRVTTILKMWQRIEQETTAQDWNLEIVGDGPDLQQFKELASKLELKRCSFTGRQNPLEYYRHSALFFMTSEFEGFPMTLVEAQQMGCIPVAFDSFGSLHEVVTDGVNGRIVPNNDIEQYIKTMLELMNDAEGRNRLIKNAITSCKAYSQASICNRWKQLLEQLVTA